MSLPELHGWLPARARARTDRIHPSTVRRRASWGDYEVTPNPLGPGALYRRKEANPSGRSPAGSPGLVPVSRVVSPQVYVPSGGDKLILGVLPASITGIAGHLGMSKGRVKRGLERLERAGLAYPAETIPPGPKGGRPAIIWRAV